MIFRVPKMLNIFLHILGATGALAAFLICAMERVSGAAFYLIFWFFFVGMMILRTKYRAW